jgi:hypothetical protein
MAGAGTVLGAVIALIVQIHAVAPFTGQLARKDPTFQLRGWPEIGTELRKIAAERGAHFVLTSGYGLNGQIDFLLKEDLPVHQFSQRIRYIMAPQPDEGGFDGTGLYISEARRDQSETLKAAFGSVQQVAVLERSVKGVGLEKLHVYEISGRKGPVLEPVATE